MGMCSAVYVAGPIRFSLSELLDKVIHPGRGPKDEDFDPGHPFTPPISQPSKEEREDDDEDGPNFPMDPVLA